MAKDDSPHSTARVFLCRQKIVYQIYTTGHMSEGLPFDNDNFMRCVGFFGTVFYKSVAEKTVAILHHLRASAPKAVLMELYFRTARSYLT